MVWGYPSGMSTQAQINSNQVNAQHSTGPVTAAGKARSARNALRHGLTSKDVVIPPGKEEAFRTLQNSLSVELQPEGAVQELVFRQLVHAAWNLERIRLMEAATDIADPKFGLLLRYQAQAERSFHRALKQLRELHTLRHQQELHEIFVPPGEGLGLPALADPRLVQRRQFTGQPLTTARPRPTKEIFAIPPPR
jgi:hypothetical protein